MSNTEATLTSLARRPKLVTLVMAAAVATLAMTMFVPSIPSLARDFGVSETLVQFGLSGFLAVTAIVQLLCGPFSDLYGRRPVLIVCMALFVVGTLVCMAAATPALFLAGRVLQAASAAGMVLSRTVLRDIYPREKAASMIGYTVMAMAVAPMVGPWIGGVLDESVGWRGSFAVMGAVGAVSLALVILDLPETNAARGRAFEEQRLAYRDLLSTPAFWIFVATGSLSSSIYFAFLGGAAQIATTTLGMTPASYGAWFAFCAGGYVFGNFLSGRFAERTGLGAMIVAGTTFALLGPVAILLAFSAGATHPFALFGWIALVGVGNGMVLPSNIAAAVSLRPDAAGAASGLLGTLQTLTGAVGATVAAWIVRAGDRPVPFALFLLLIALGATLFGVLSAREATRR